MVIYFISLHSIHFPWGGTTKTLSFFFEGVPHSPPPLIVVGLQPHVREESTGDLATCLRYQLWLWYFLSVLGHTASRCPPFQEDRAQAKEFKQESGFWQIVRNIFLVVSAVAQWKTPLQCRFLNRGGMAICQGCLSWRFPELAGGRLDDPFGWHSNSKVQCFWILKIYWRWHLIKSIGSPFLHIFCSSPFRRWFFEGRSPNLTFPHCFKR